MGIYIITQIRKNILFEVKQANNSADIKQKNQGIQVKPWYRVLRGGGWMTIKFNSLTNAVLMKFTPQAPKWRMIGQGLNFEGVCVKNQCSAYEQLVWIPKGFGKFNIHKQVYSSCCPICSSPCQDVNNIGIYHAICKGKGMIKGQNKQKQMQSIHNGKDDFLTFEDKDETRLEWLYLELEVIQL